MKKKIYLVTFCLNGKHIAYEIVADSTNKARNIATSVFLKNYTYKDYIYMSTIELKEPTKFIYL